MEKRNGNYKRKYIWTEDKLTILQRDYQSKGAKAVALEVGIPVKSVTYKARRLGLQRVKGWRWQNYPKDQLRKYLEDGMSVQEIAHKVGASYWATIKHLNDIGIYRQPLWTGKKFAFLKAHYHVDMNATQVAEALGLKREQIWTMQKHLNQQRARG